MGKRYSKDHEWVNISADQDDVAFIGISDYAQKQLGDVVFVELPEIGKNIEKGGEGAVVESVKAASEVYLPIDAEIIDINLALQTDPSLVNKDAEEKAWFFKVKIKDPSQIHALMDEGTYQTYLADLS